MSEWFVSIGYEGQLATWLVASFLLYTLAAQLAWQFHWFFVEGPFSLEVLDEELPSEDVAADTTTVDIEWEDGTEEASLIDRTRGFLLIPWVEEAIRFLYYLGIPFLAALNGLLPADLLGVQGTEWVGDQGLQGFPWEEWVQGIGLMVAAVVAMVAVWLVGRWVCNRAGLAPVSPDLPGPLWQRVMHAFYDQIHWAFYRSGPILWLGDVYWGTFAGLALTLVEILLNPSVRWSLKNSETAGPPLFRLGMAWITALLFLATQNLWLTIGFHFILAGLMASGKGRAYAVMVPSE
jgi:hypothetical protein